uniref:Uncharacterized protein n=1 Tax=Ditylenchus dipsaci TaxID=166011 RepID=A0A915CTN3_9BILA
MRSDTGKVAKKEWAGKFEQQDSKYHGQLHVLRSKLDLRDDEIIQLTLTNKDIKAEMQRKNRKEIDHLRLQHSNQITNEHNPTQRLEETIYKMGCELESLRSIEESLQSKLESKERILKTAKDR